MRERLALFATLAFAVGPGSLAGQAPSGFDHAKHRKLFASCTACHLGAAERGAPIWPDAASCASCHDGTIRKRVAWEPPREPARTNLRFDHIDHERAAGVVVSEHKPERRLRRSPVSLTERSPYRSGAAYLIVHIGS